MHSGIELHRPRPKYLLSSAHLLYCTVQTPHCILPNSTLNSVTVRATDAQTIRKENEMPITEAMVISLDVMNSIRSVTSCSTSSSSVPSSPPSSGLETRP